jgi:hypothetical protein
MQTIVFVGTEESVVADVFTLNGEITEDGGSVKVVNANGTVGDSTITFGPAGKSAQVRTAGSRSLRQ